MSSPIQSVDWVAVAPPLVTAVAALAVLIADLFVPPSRKPLLGWAAAAGLVLAGLSLIPLLDGDRTTFCLTTRAGYCSYVADHFTVAVQLLVLGGALLTVLLSLHTVEEARMPAGEYWFLLLASASGAALLPASRDLATLVIALEVASLPAFALVGLRRGDRRSSEAALKFFLSSVTATAVTLLGVSFVYAATGSMHLSGVARGLTHVDGRLVTLAHVGAVLTLVGFAFKVAAVPFHFWVPDAYVGAPLPVAAYLSVVGKAAGFSGLILLTVLGFGGYAHIWGTTLAVLAAATMTVGNVAALRQRPGHPYSAVRLLAWSSVGQAGYLLVPLAAAGYADRATAARTPAQTVGATVAYALMYTAVNLGAFAVAALVGRAHALNRLTDYRALFARRPAAALCLAFFLLCLAGLPPGVIGLFAKVAVFRTAVDAGLGWLAVVMAVNVVVALVYYVRWTAVLFARAEEAREAGGTAGGAVPEAVGAAGAVAGGAVPEGTAVAAGTPLPLVAAITAAFALGVALSGAPELVLRFTSTALF
jgi:NADH-quinone oxidoreductase subunit N